MKYSNKYKHVTLLIAFSFCSIFILHCEDKNNVNDEKSKPVDTDTFNVPGSDSYVNYQQIPDTDSDTAIFINNDITIVDSDTALPLGPVCGNGKLEYGEECDDDNNMDGDGCQSDCKEEICGNGRVENVEECDDGNDVSLDRGNPERCDKYCKEQICGNGRKEDGEVCDDGIHEDVEAGCAYCRWANDTEYQCGDCPQMECSGDELSTDTDARDPNLYGNCYNIQEGYSPDGGLLQVDEEIANQCQSLMQCMDISGCASPKNNDSIFMGSNVYSNCYCGADVDMLDCQYYNAANGPCKAEVEDAAQSSDPRVIELRLSNDKFALGIALSLIDCVDKNCTNCYDGTCGNGVVDPLEECDDANSENGDRCSAACEEEICGNGRLDWAEECDFGTPAPEDTANICVDCAYVQDCPTCNSEKCLTDTGVDLSAACLEAEGDTGVQCRAAMACAWGSGCDSMESCYCGEYVSEADCVDVATGGPVGPCRDEIEAATGTTDPAAVLAAMATPPPDTAIGHATRLMSCDQNNCPMCIGYSYEYQEDGSTDGTSTDPSQGTDTDVDTGINLEECAVCQAEYCTEVEYLPGGIGESDDVVDRNLRIECTAEQNGDLCTSILACVQESRCASDGSHTPCYCGDVPNALCVSGRANGPCIAEIEAGAETTDPWEVTERYTNTDYAVGDAMTIVICEIQNCPMCL